MRRSQQVAGFLLFVALVVALSVLGGCSTGSPAVQTRVVEVPSSKPYRYITWSPADTAETKKQVRAHNRAHQEVVKAEKQAKP
jgi:hypothetical protein